MGGGGQECGSFGLESRLIHSGADATGVRSNDGADEALASNEAAANWARNNVLEFTKGMPEVMVGTALVAA